MAEQKIFVTDMNARERAKFIASLKKVEESVGKCVLALETENDQELLFNFMMASITWDAVGKEVFTVLKSAVSTTVPDAPPEAPAPPPMHGFGA